MLNSVHVPCSAHKVQGQNFTALRFVAHLALLGFLLLGLASSLRAQSDSDSVPPGGSESDLLNAIQNAISDGSDYVSFEGSASITLSAPIEIIGVTNFTIDGNGFDPSISGGGVSNVFIFQIDSGLEFTAIDLTITDGENTNGGAIYVQEDALLYMTNCVLSGNMAVGTNANAGANGLSSLQSNGQNGQRGQAGSSGLGGAIYNLGQVILLDCNLSGNAAKGGSGGAGGSGGSASGELARGGNGGAGGAGQEALGGAIYNLGPSFPGQPSVVLSNCTFMGNSVAGGSGGAGGAGGAGFTPGLSGSGGAGGTAKGGALYSTSAVLIVNCTFATNSAQSGASAPGGTSQKGASGPGGASAYGGGIYLVGQDGLETDMTNCTFYENAVIGGTGGNGGSGSVTGGHGGTGGNGTGGGIYFESQKVNVTNVPGYFAPDLARRSAKKVKNVYTNSTFVAVNCTFTMGSASGGTNGSGGSGPLAGFNGSRGHGYGGNIASGAGYFVIRNSIIGTNLTGGSASGKFVDGDYNLLQDESISLSKKHSHRRTNVLLYSLQNNGGLTPTLEPQVPTIGTNQNLALLSPALEKVPAELCPATDQRGVPRPAASDYGDIGAFELVAAPIILTAPMNTVTTNGAYTNLMVSAVGDEATPKLRLNYQWRLNGTPIVGQINNSNYWPLPSANLTNQGGYDVVVSGKFGSVTSSPPAYFLFIPYILTNPVAPVGVAQGSNLVLQATAVGTVGPSYPSLRYIWQLNGTNLTTQSLAATNGIYTALGGGNSLSNHTVTMSYTVFGNLTNAGDYTIAITNLYGAVTSSICTVPVGVAITNPPPSTVYATPGSSVTLSVGANGSPPLTYTWTFTSSQGTISTVGSAATFSIGGIQPSQFGTYTITVANSVNSASYSVNVINGNQQSSGPLITLQPTNQFVIAGSNATFSVIAQNANAYQWLFNGSTNILGAVTTNSILTLTNVQTTNAGNYSVEVSNSQGETNSQDAVLTVEVAPYILTQPTNETVVAGSNAEFSVTAGGGGLVYQWFFNGTNAVAGGVLTNGLTNSVLILTNVTAAEAGAYSLLITNLAGSTNSTNAFLAVITNSPQILAARDEKLSGPETLAGLTPAAVATSAGASAISSVSVVSNVIAFVYPEVANTTYVLEYKSSLADEEWLALQTNTPASNGPVLYEDASTNGPSRFYRIRVK